MWNRGPVLRHVTMTLETDKSVTRIPSQAQRVLELDDEGVHMIRLHISDGIARRNLKPRKGALRHRRQTLQFGPSQAYYVWWSNKQS